MLAAVLGGLIVFGVLGAIPTLEWLQPYLLTSGWRAGDRRAARPAAPRRDARRDVRALCYLRWAPRRPSRGCCAATPDGALQVLTPPEGPGWTMPALLDDAAIERPSRTARLAARGRRARATPNCRASRWRSASWPGSAEIAEGRDHHPDIDIRWRTLTFRCSTHSEGGITQRDVDLAAAISEQVEATVMTTTPEKAKRPNREEGLREGAPAPAGRARRDAGVGAHQRRPVVVVFEGRDAAGKGGTIKRVTEYLNPRVARIVALPAPTERERSAVVLPALRRAPARGRGDRAARPLLVQPRRRRAGDGVLHAGRSTTGSCTRPDLRADARRRRHPAAQVLVLGQRPRAGAAVPDRLQRPDAAVEALADGPAVDHAVGGLLAREGRDVRPHRHRRCAVVRWRPRTSAARGST